MSDAFALLDAARARAYLAAFDVDTRTRGEADFHAGCVEQLGPVPDGFKVVVRLLQVHEVLLVLQEEDGWLSQCTCQRATECRHAYAAMRAILAEHNLARVRGLSAGLLNPAPPAPASGGPGKRRSGTPDFAQEVAVTLGRRLRKPEAEFLKTLSLIHARCRLSAQITSWDFDELGLGLGGNGWEVLAIWPAFPDTVREFWQYVANTAVEKGREIPEFLQPVTDLAAVREQLAEWRRRQEIDRWRDRLRNVATTPQVEAPRVEGVFDLRVVFGAREAVLEWKRPGEDAFELPKATQHQTLAEDYRAGLISLTVEAERIWHALEQRVFFARDVRFSYADPESLAALARLFRTRGLEDRLVNAEGEPLRRPALPAHWLVTAPDTADGDYLFALVTSEGQPLSPLLCVLPGQPTLYLTNDAVHAGPPMLSRVLDPARENCIPAPALETVPGLRLFQALQLDLPERVRDRVRHVPLRATIRCELRPIYLGSMTENCLFHVTAESADGARQETWDGHHWQELPSIAGRRKERSDEGLIALYDRSGLEGVPRVLEPLDLKRDAESSAFVLRVSKKFPETFLAWLKSVPPQISVALTGELASLGQDAVSGRIRLQVDEAEIDWFDLRVVLDVADTTLTPEELKLLMNAKGGFVRLRGKGWRRLEFAVSPSEDEQLARLGLNPHQLTSEPQRLHALQLADGAARHFLPEPQLEQIRRRVEEIKARVSPALPAGITAALRPYQLEGFHFLAYLATNRFGGILADDMGLGKTLQALAWLMWLREEAIAGGARPIAPDGGAPDVSKAPAAVPPLRPSLVVCPKSVMDNWQAEAERFAPGLRVKIWSAGELETLVHRLEEADLHVLNYSHLRILGESLSYAVWQAVILDEGQYIKNPGSQTAQVARALHAENRLVLSGTPIENRLLDLWSLMAFAMPGVLGSRHHFARLYDAKDDPFARRRLAARVRPFLLRRTKGQVAKDLPDRVEEDLYCEIEGEQLVLYRAEFKRAQQLLLNVSTQKELAEFQFHFLASLLRLRQICCHPRLVAPDSKAESAKLTALLEQLEPLMEEGHKVLVFSQFVELLALLKPALAAHEWPLFYLTGDTENRGELVREFQSAPGAAVFLISLKAGGFGLNLTAASYVVLFDPWWNPAVENQAIDRTHRIGQTNKVIAYRLLIKNSIEEKIRRLQRLKKALAEDVLGEEKFAQSLTLDDLRFLFAD